MESWQRTFPEQPVWLWPSGQRADFTGYRPPLRSVPALASLSGTGPLVSVIGTVKHEALPLRRSLSVWAKQYVPSWLKGRIDFWILDDGSFDDPVAVVEEFRGQMPWANLRYAKFREPDEGGDRSCTLLFNAAYRGLVESPLVITQWWDRIPGSLFHLVALIEPHRRLAGIATSAISRHIGGSSSVDGMNAEQLAAVLSRVPWERDPMLLEEIAGPIGGHCIPGQASESSGLCVSLEEIIRIGGYDERYQERAGYSNVELFRRLLQTKLEIVYPTPVHAYNFHQSHAANRVKTTGYLDDPMVCRNLGVEWGMLAPIDLR